jgi:4-oxalocrotonate tautomerase
MPGTVVRSAALMTSRHGRCGRYGSAPNVRLDRSDCQSAIGRSSGFCPTGRVGPSGRPLLGRTSNGRGPDGWRTGPRSTIGVTQAGRVVHAYFQSNTQTEAKHQMPIISVQLLRGRSPELKRRLMRELADAAINSLGVPEQSVRVILTEIEPEHWGIGTKTKAEIDGGGNK